MHIPNRLMAQIDNTQKNDLLLCVLCGEPVRVPVWMMRQAGRTDPEYIALRKADGRPLEELFGDVASIRVSLLPKRLGVDAIIMFQDILTSLAPMGVPFIFRPGPISEPIQTLEQVHHLRLPDPATDLSHVGAIYKEFTKNCGVSSVLDLLELLSHWLSVSRRILIASRKRFWESLKIIPNL